MPPLRRWVHLLRRRNGISLFGAEEKPWKSLFLAQIPPDAGSAFLIRGLDTESYAEATEIDSPEGELWAAAFVSGGPPVWLNVGAVRKWISEGQPPAAHESACEVHVRSKCRHERATMSALPSIR
jgi:hypothetical protein